LKDDRSQLRCAMFRNAAQLLVFRPVDGQEVIVRGRVSLYAERGDLQLYVDTMEPQGRGALQLAFEQLKARLAAEGLFDEGRKRALPFFPTSVGIATALSGAALHDILVILRSRCPALHVVVRPIRVQGVGSAEDICQAIADLNAHRDLEVLIVGRGGGSLEDLWSFNEERVARAIAASRLPIVSAVGHEVDFTIADFVADRRAPTPTAAAELVVPRLDDLRALVARGQAGLAGALARRSARERRHLERWRVGSRPRAGAGSPRRERCVGRPPRGGDAASPRQDPRRDRCLCASTRRPASGRAGRGARADGRRVAAPARACGAPRARGGAGSGRAGRRVARRSQPARRLAARVQPRAAGVRRCHHTVQSDARARGRSADQLRGRLGPGACRAERRWAASGPRRGRRRMTDQKPQKFEDGLAELESTVAKLESGELTLEDSLAAFERGVGLVKALNERLGAVEQRIEILTRDGSGKLRTRPFEVDGE
jgi:exodeoxyribonuclease VII small subunit